MINKEFMIKKLQATIKENKQIAKLLYIKYENEKKKNNCVEETIINNIVNMLVCNETEIQVYKDLIKKIKNGEFDTKHLLN